VFDARIDMCVSRGFRATRMIKGSAGDGVETVSGHIKCVCMVVANLKFPSDDGDRTKQRESVFTIQTLN